MKLLLLFLTLFLSVSSQAQHKPSKILFDGEVYKSFNYSGIKYKTNTSQNSTTDAFTSISFVSMSSLRNYYDLQSNATPLQIWQDPANQNNIHAVYTFSDEETAWSNRTVQYFFSDDRGQTWYLVGNVPATGRAGFGTITGLSSGAAVISNHTNYGGGVVRTQIFVDAFPGLGSFSNLNPGGTQESKYIWPRIVGTQNVSLTNKFVFASSTNSTKFDSVYWNTSRSITSNNFLGYQKFNGSTTETYALAKGTDGRIGLAYMVGSVSDPSQTGDVYFMESTDNGSSFGTPVRIFDANFNTDSLAMLRGISMVYKLNTPCVAFETIRQTIEGEYFPDLPSKIRFWSPVINGGNSVVIADRNNVPFAPAQGTIDLEGAICRPSIGISSDNNFLFCSMMVQNSATGGNDMTSYNDIYLARSGNGGSNWAVERITPLSPRNDWAFASISPTNDVQGGNYFVNMIMQKDTVPGSNVNSGNWLTNAKPYFVRVSYTGTPTPPSVPSLLSPPNGAVNQSLTPTLFWTITGETHGLQVSTTSNFSNIILNQGISGGSYTIPQPYLTQNTIYYWRVNSSSPGGTSSYSSPYSFTTTNASLPAAPSLISPLNGAAGISTMPSFDWSDVSGATTYRFQLSTTNTFSTTVVDSLNLTSSQFTLPFAISNSTIFYWRVCANNSAGSGPFSITSNFTTTAAPPGPPTLVSPSDGAVGIPLTTNIVWFPISGATSYNLQIATDVNFVNTIYNVVPTGSNHTVASGILQLNTLYFWRVRASNAGGYGPYSVTRNFRSIVSGVNSIGTVIPTEFKLYSNYPNPFNPSTTIRFDIPENTDVKIKVFDQTGKMIAELINSELQAGAYETSFNASSFSSGIYYFRIEAGEFHDTKKMILLK